MHQAPLTPFIHLLDDGFRLGGESDMSEINRDLLDLVKQTMCTRHQYPGGFTLYLGTMFSPINEHSCERQGFTHHLGTYAWGTGRQCRQK